jgi:hypothetical protein
VGNAPASAREALDLVRAGLGYLAAADAAELGTATQAECLRELERAEAVLTAARAFILAGFTAGQGYSADADYSPRAWLIHQTRVSKGAAVAHTAWTRRAAEHPRVVAALATGELSESYGRTICAWTDKLPEDFRAAADAILLSAALAGMDLRDLAGLAAEIYERSRAGLPDEDPARGFEDRAVRLVTTFQGAGVLNGDLTPNAPRSSMPCWTPWMPWRVRRTPGPGSSDTTTRCRKRCAVWSPVICSPSGPASRPRVGPYVPGRPAPPGRQLRPARTVEFWPAAA